MRGETFPIAICLYLLYISIHSPHARGDDVAAVLDVNSLAFQSTPLMRGETLVDDEFFQIYTFQSTPLMRGETRSRSAIFCFTVYFNPLPSCEGRQIPIYLMQDRNNFNPLPSCEGRPPRIDYISININFNPLPSCEGRQHKPPKILLNSRQSIQQKHHSSFF